MTVEEAIASDARYATRLHTIGVLCNAPLTPLATLAPSLPKRLVCTDLTPERCRMDDLWSEQDRSNRR